MKGMDKRGNCPSNYNTVDKTQTVKQCPDGKTNPRYCNPINVTIETKGEAKVLSLAIESNETCLHEEDTEDHKCFEACAESKYATKGIKQEGKCPSSYNTVDKTQTVEQCPDGVTNIRYCNPINVTFETKGETGEVFTLAAEDKVCIHKLDSVDNKCYEACAESKFAMKGMDKRGNCPSNYNTVDKPQTVKQCPDGKTNPRYCNPINVTIETKGEAKVLSLAIESNETCLHEEDTEDHKCFEACAESKFATKGIKQEGKCPSSYNTVDKTQTVEQCPDGMTSIRYCNPINVTIATKGEAGEVFTLAAEDSFCWHEVDEEDHKCFEACSESKFATKGVTEQGKCPSSYNTVDKTQ